MQENIQINELTKSSLDDPIVQEYLISKIDYIDKTLSDEILKKPFKMDEVGLSVLPQTTFPEVAIGINLNSHEIIKIEFARKEKKQENEPTPHIIVAGATNSGKSQFAKLLIHQIANSGSPDLVRMILIDPKVVTFSMFNWLPHLYCPVITQWEKLLPIFEDLLILIQQRYEIFAKVWVETIEAYRFHNSQKMFSIVVIMDEFADLFDSYDYKGKAEIERIMKRFWQMARAAGIHLVLITQRATSQNIPNEVRTHFAGNISFRANSEADSHYIIWEPWAEKLQSAGQFLFKKPWQEIQSGYSPLCHNKELVEYMKSVSDNLVHNLEK